MDVRDGSSTPGGGGVGTPVGDPVSLWTLLAAVGDHRLVHALTRDIVTFEQLAAAPWAETVGRVGVWAARLRLPPAPGPLPDLAGAVPVSRYVPGPYPAALLDLPDPPVLITVAGAVDLLGGAHVTVGGTRHPSPGGRTAARAAAVAAAHVGVSVVAVADGGAGTVALEQCAALAHPAVMVATHDPTVTGVDGRLAASVVAAGGCVVAVAMPDHDPVGQVRWAARIAAALGRAVVLAELGVHADGGVLLARTAIDLGRHLIVPAPDADLGGPPEASGTAVLARADTFDPAWFGTSERISSRVASGRPPADTVASTMTDLAAAIAAACRR